MRRAFPLSFQNAMGNGQKLDRECCGRAKGTEESERVRKVWMLPF